MGIVPKIISDAKAMGGDVICSEKDIQKAYKDSVKETNTSIGRFH